MQSVQSGDVLYLALEDSERRVQDRLNRQLSATGLTAPSSLIVSTNSERLDKGGLKDLEGWIDAHSHAHLTVVDTLVKVRPQPKRNGSAYTDDHDSVAGLKKLADKFSLAILVVHHLRKLPSSNPLEAVSGTLGLTGCCDGVLVLNRRRGQPAGSLNVMGRDVEERELAVRFDSDLGLWKFEGESAIDSPSKMGPERQEI